MKVYHEAISGRVGGELGWMVKITIIAFVPVLAQVFRSFVPKVGLRPCMPCAGCGRWVRDAQPEDWIRVGPPESEAALRLID